MSLNQGIQRYKEVATKTSSSKKAASTPTKTAKAVTAAKENTKDKEKKNSKSQDEKFTGAKLKNGVTAAPSPVDEAVGEKVEAEKRAAEEQALQQEIEKELKEDAVHTSGLVRDDYTPVNTPRDRLIGEYAPLIKYIAQKIAARLPANIELDDLISSGVIGLMDAIDKYDNTRDNKFKTYAEFRIRGAILDELRAQDWVPRSVREKAKQLERCYQKIEQEKGRHATDEEVMEQLGINQEEFHDLLAQVRNVSLVSFDDLTSFSNADKRAIHGFNEANSRVTTPFNEINSGAMKKVISQSIADLPEKQRLVLSLYYYEDLNLKEIGQVLDVTESRVSQLHTQAVLKLKAKLRAHLDEIFADD